MKFNKRFFQLISIAAFTLFLSSCSVLELFDEGDNQGPLSKSYRSSDEDKKQQLVEKKNFCESPKVNTQILSDDKETLEFYQSLETLIQNNPKYNFIDKAIMITLIELVRRPDQIGPHSRFQVYLKLDNKDYYYDFKPKDYKLEKGLPLIVGLEFLAKKFKKNNNINTIISDLEKSAPSDILVTKDLEQFLRTHNKQLIKSDYLYESFMKGDEVITRYETFKRPSFKKIMSMYPSSKNIELYHYEASNILANTGPYKCNFRVADEMSFLKTDENHEFKKSHTIGYIQDKNIFLAVASFEIDPSYTHQFSDLYFFKAKSAKYAYPFCYINNNSNEVALFSAEGRNPEQYMQHLLSYEIENSKEHAEVNQVLNFSRHLVLSNPDRILYESKKGRKNQLNFFLTMNFPVYHVEALGNIFGFASIKGVNKSRPILHIDSRHAGELWCK